MTPPDNASNRTLVGIAAALGIAIGVAPTALLSQSTTTTTGAAVTGTPDNAIAGTQAKMTKRAQEKGVTGTAAGTGTVMTQTAPLVATQTKGVAAVQTKGVPAVQTKGVPPVQPKVNPTP